MIVNDERANALKVQSDGGRGGGFTGFDTELNPAVKRAAFSDAAFHPDLTVHQFCELLGDRQAESGAPKLSRDRSMSLGKTFENGPQLVWRNADPGIRHRETNRARGKMVGVVRDFNDDGPLVRELDRVADEVDENLMQ